MARLPLQGLAARRQVLFDELREGTLVADAVAAATEEVDAAARPTRRMVKLILRVDGVGERRSTPSTRSSLLAARESFHAGRRGACAAACDTSDALIDIAHKAHEDKRYECLVADGVRLPYRSNAFDVATPNAVATHHPSC